MRNSIDVRGLFNLEICVPCQYELQWILISIAKVATETQPVKKQVLKVVYSSLPNTCL